MNNDKTNAAAITSKTYMHGEVNGCIGQWRLGGKVNGAWRLSHVKLPSQMTAHADQFVTWETVERLAK